MKKLQLQLVDSILTLSWIGVLLSIAILSLSLTNHLQISKSELANQQGCGTVAATLPVNFSDAEEELYLLGKKMFKLNCAACHNRNMVDDMTGPALGMISDSWADYPREDLYQWIRNSQQLIDKQHPKALELWKVWGPSIMTSFENLTDEEIESILMYIEVMSRK